MSSSSTLPEVPSGVQLQCLTLMQMRTASSGHLPIA